MKKKNYKIIDEELGVGDTHRGDSAGSRLVVFQAPERHHVVGLLWKTERSKTRGKSHKETVSYSI